MNARPIGKLEMAEVLQVLPGTVHKWRQRDLLPPADYPAVNGYPAWELLTILHWVTRSRRRIDVRGLPVFDTLPDDARQELSDLYDEVRAPAAKAA